MAEWKKVLISGSNIDVAEISASGVPTVDTEDNLLAITSEGFVKQILQANVAGENTMGSGFVLEDGDGTEVTITENQEVKFIEGSNKIDIDWTDTSNGTDGDPYDLTFDINANNVFTAIDSSTVGTFTSSYADSASKALVTKDLTTNTDFPLIFGENVGSEASIYAGLFQDTGITINPSTSTITATNFAGNATTATNATNATNATYIDVNDATADAAYRITMVDNTGTGYEQLYVDSGITFNPTTNNITIAGSASIAGDLTVEGATTTLNTQNLLVEDRYILLGSSSAINTVGGGIVIANTDNNTDGTGTALFYDKDTRRWSIDASGADPTSADGANSDVGIVTVEITTNSDPDNSNAADNPIMGTSATNQGQMWVNRTPSAGESGIWIYS